ncbi:conserved hypothetical protein [Candidatus Desulfosporosinus infrequens]|uniref:DUF1653 domain-containing protein n=1 Tax=Candidatus Desulfosporosinus infrequens TaxID=2043169 RepID=A0A2U3LP53_9FIRM|nr:conserved hypothetical protein [Candidatus Desulfosporosinus infrequens]
MEPRKPVIGSKYCHFKNKMYQLLAVATHSENEGNMFLSEVDHVKYPEVIRKYRFELMQEPEL